MSLEEKKLLSSQFRRSMKCYGQEWAVVKTCTYEACGLRRNSARAG